MDAKAKIHPRNSLNNLSANEWITRTVSVLVQKGLGKNSAEAKFEKQHPAPFSFQDVARFIEFFTRPGEHVLDPFAGVSSSLKASLLLDRKATGIELNPHFVSLSKKRLKAEVGARLAKDRYKIFKGDSRKVCTKFADNQFDFMVTSPPYWGILDKVDHKATQERVANGLRHNYGNLSGDFAGIESYKSFVSELVDFFDGTSRIIKKDKYCVIIVGDFRNKSKYHMFHSDLADQLEARNHWVLKGITILYQKHKRVFPYGYPYAYVPNIHHQYALIFQNKK